MTFPALFEPLDLGSGLVLPNRILLAPCTRNRASADLGPSVGAAAYYAARADAGLLITEATLVTPQAQGYLDTPGLFSDAHIPAWARVCDSVHARGGRIFAQLWHTGRLAHSHWSGTQPVAPSAVLDPILRRQAGGVELYNEMPRALAADEIPPLVELFHQASRRARLAGFDGVEIHGANGYLLEQFLRAHTNRRSDDWGSTLEGRLRFVLEVLEACMKPWGPRRVGLRLSPAAYFGEMKWSPSDNGVYVELLRRVKPLQPAYIHTGVIDDRFYDELGCTSTEFLRRHWDGVLLGNGSYTPQRAQNAVASGACDLVSFGRSFIANPDLVERLRQGLPLVTYRPEMTKALE